MRLRTRYGIDAPRVVGVFILFGLMLLLPTAQAVAWPGSIIVAAPWRAGAALIGGVLLMWAGIMLWSSLVSKLAVRDRLVGTLALREGDRVLDAGCGRGLTLIGCARELTTGKAVGIDLWAVHLSGNSQRATLENAHAAGVADRVEVLTGDITDLPFADASFDAAISMTVIHNIPSRDGREQALRELVRVLKPGGRLVVFDLLYATSYAQVLRQAGMTVEHLGTTLLWLWPCRSLLALKA